MTEDVHLFDDDSAGEQRQHERIELVAVPDDPADVTEVTIYPADVPAEELSTAWIAADVTDVVDLLHVQ